MRHFPLTLAAVTALFLHSAAHAQEAPLRKCYFVRVGALPIEFDGSQGRVDGKINEQKTTFIVDTGAYRTQIFEDAAERLHLPLAPAGIDNVTAGVGGVSRNYLAFIKNIEMGGLSAKNHSFSVVGSHGKTVGSDGLLGSDFLMQADMELDISNKSIKFFRPVDCGDAHLAYWDENAQWVELRSLGAKDPRPAIDVTIDGKKFRAVIDTGAMTTILDLYAAEKAGFKIDTPDSKASMSEGVGGKGMARWFASFKEVAIGSESIKNVQLNVADLWGNIGAGSNRREARENDAELLLGVDFLRVHRVLFSKSQNRFYFTYLGGKLFDTPAAPPPQTAAGASDNMPDTSEAGK